MRLALKGRYLTARGAAPGIVKDPDLLREAL